jgi:hypothetical protein
VTEWTYYPASTLPAPFDIVWCAFPEHLDLGKPAPKMRPGLVITNALRGKDELPFVQVIYGTSNLKQQQRRHDFFVTNYQEMYDAGLHQATRFDLDRILWLPWAVEFFKPVSSQYADPTMGHLSDRMLRRAGHILSEHQRRKNRDK